jgi:hypothetical protein
MILDTDDKNIIREVKSLFSNRKAVNTEVDLEKFYSGFRAGVREVKSSLNQKTALKDAQSWLDSRN